MKRFAFVITAAVLVALIAGCEPIRKVGEATVSFVRGDLNIEEMNYPIGEVHKAAVKAMDQLEIRIVDEDQSPLKSYISGRDSDDDKVQIWLWRVETDVTKLKIRIGLTGNETKSWAIYDQIQQNL